MDIAGLNWPAYLPRLLWISRVCPRCSSFEFKEAESRSLDGPLGLLAFRPVRCANEVRPQGIREQGVTAAVSGVAQR